MPCISIERSGKVALITIRRPSAMNAIDFQTSCEFIACLDKVESDAKIGAMVIAGEGDAAFSAGGDLKSLSDGMPHPTHPTFGFAGFVRYPRSKPAIAAVNGVALGGGFEIALACDLIVAGEGATFGLPEVNHGLVAGGGGLLSIGSRLSYVQACELALTGESISAGRALKLGLINRVVPNGSTLASARSLAETIANKAPLAIRNSLSILRSVAHSGCIQSSGLNDALSREVLASADAKEGMQAFIEGRHPVWVGL